MCWNFFASSHKNGKVDSVYALFKWEICKEIKPQAAKLQNAHDVVTFSTRSMYNIAHQYYLHLSL
jgi:hypothetical protein